MRAACVLRHRRGRCPRTSHVEVRVTADLDRVAAERCWSLEADLYLLGEGRVLRHDLANDPLEFRTVCRSVFGFAAQAREQLAAEFAEGRLCRSPRRLFGRRPSRRTKWPARKA